MFCVIDKSTKKVIKIGYTISVSPESEHEALENNLPQGYTAETAEILKWHDDDPKTQQLFQPNKEFTAQFDDNGNLTGFLETDLPVPPAPDEITAQIIAQLTLDNADLKQQLQTLAQTLAQMQLGGV